MADSPSSPATLEPQAQASEHESASTQSNQLEPPPESISTAPTHPSSSSLSATAPVLVNPSPNPPLVSPPPPSIQSFAPPSFRPAFPPVPFSSPQFSPLPNPTMQYQNPSIQHPNNLQVQPPGVNPVSAMLPGATSGAGSVAISGSPMMPIGHYQAPPGQLPNPAVRPYAPMSNGFPTMQTAVPQGTMPPPVLITWSEGFQGFAVL